jgi:hypothetical protein
MNQTMIHRAIDLLSFVLPGKNAEETARLSIGERDATLLHLREWLFGRQLHNLAKCPVCSEQIEWDMDTREIISQSAVYEKSPEEFLLKENGYAILFRLPDSNDLSEAMVIKENTAGEWKLLERLIIDCKYNGKPFKIKKLPERILTLLDQKIGENIPQADIVMNINCVNCNNQWDVPFDIMSYLWGEINNWARHILQDISTLARTYGWSEKDILLMSPARRRIYLDLINS